MVQKFVEEEKTIEKIRKLEQISFDEGSILQTVMFHTISQLELDLIRANQVKRLLLE